LGWTGSGYSLPILETGSEKRDDLLQVLEVPVVEVGWLVRIHVEHSHESPRRVCDWHHDLRLCLRITGDVAGKGVDIGDDQRLARTSHSAADAIAERYLETADRTLVGTNSQELGVHHAIEPDPTDRRNRIEEDGRDAGHGSDRVVQSCEE
jgi:hypothetical protein